MRALIVATVIGLAVALGLLISDLGGNVVIRWQDWSVETSLPILIGAVLVAALVAFIILDLLRRIINGPRRFAQSRREKRRDRGYLSLTQGMVAVAAGDPHEALRHSRRAEALLNEPPLTLLLQAQTAQLNGDEAAARKYFTAMLNRPETEFLGLRGLLNQSLREGDTATALRLAERAHGIRPRAQWVLTSLFELHTRRGEWEEARASLAEATKRQAIPLAVSRHNQGSLLFAESQAQARQGEIRTAIALAEKAQAYIPELAPPAAHQARLLHRTGKTKQAARVLESAWRDAPHPLLVEVYRELVADEPAGAWVKRVERLVARNRDHIESRVTMARAALDAQFWGEARRELVLAGASLDAIGADGALGNVARASAVLPQSRICRMMAELELAERGDGVAARQWLAWATEASPDPLYVCGKCEAEAHHWQPLCPRCHSFDTLSWRSPNRAPSGHPAPAGAPAAIAAPSGPALEHSPAAGQALLPAAVDVDGH